MAPAGAARRLEPLRRRATTLLLRMYFFMYEISKMTTLCLMESVSRIQEWLNILIVNADNTIY